MDDYGLLRQYVQGRSQEAFTSLVRRYVGLVYSSALRQTRDPHQAEDVTQAVFISLARKAHQINAHVVLSSWLLTAVRYQTLRDRRSRFRRRYHEHRAGQMVKAMDEQMTQQEWEQIAPQLDAAIADLGQKNRDALLLRYFEGQSMAEVGGRLGISEEAARQRVCRAVEHLRGFFAGRGVEVTSLSLASLLSAHAVQAAPAHVVALATAAATSVGVAGAATAGAAGSWIAKGAIVMAMSKAQTTVIGVVAAILAIGVTTAVVIHRAQSGDQSKVVVVQPAIPQPDTTGINASYAFQATPAADSQGPGPSGRVVTADGKPVPDAEVLLATPQNIVEVYDPARPKGPSARTDNDGRFSFPLTDKWADVVVRHTQGVAHLRAYAMPKDGRIVLQPWARIEGTLRVGNQPLANQEISLQGDSIAISTPSTNPSGTQLFLRSYVVYSQRAQTDENGRFVFTRVAPGTAVLGRLVRRSFDGGAQRAQIHNVMVVKTAPLATVHVELGGSGRPVVGKLALDDPSEKLSFFGSVNVSRSQPASLMQSLGSFAGTGKQQQTTTNKASSESVAAAMRRYHFSYPVEILPDGSFRADDIPAGEYQLTVSCEAMEASGGSANETVADGSLQFKMPEIPDGRSDEPLDVGTLTVHVRPRVKIGAPAPALEAKKPDGSTLKLSDYRGKHVLLSFVEGSRMGSRGLTVGSINPSMKIIQDRIGSNDRMVMLSIILEDQERTGQQVLGTDTAGETVAVVGKWRERLDPAYVNSPTTYLIDPEGKVQAKVSPYSNSLYGAIDRALGQMRWKRAGVRVLTEILPETQVGAAFPFKTIPTISMEDAGQSAVFSIVDGNKADFAGGLNALNDGLGPRHARDESLMFAFAPNTLEGRLKADLGKVIEVSQINTFAWYKDGNRWAQVYRVYGSDGSDFDPEPKIGTDPGSCGWSWIAAVDTRTTPGGTDLRNGAMGQSGVSIQGETGPIGKYRYLLFVTFATETHNVWGQTFWSEIDIVGK